MNQEEEYKMNGNIESSITEVAPPTNWEAFPDPTPEMLESPLFDAIWQRIKTWDINVPSAYAGYTGAMGNHVRAIIEAIRGVPSGNV